jgi:flagella basal body P-ring formation protein FlgA
MTPASPSGRLSLWSLAALTLAALALIWPLATAGAGVSVIFPPDNTVEGARVVLGQIATVAPDDDADKPLADLVAAVDLGPAPEAGEDLVLRRRQIENRLSASGAPISEIRWLIPDEVRLTGGGTATDDKRIREIIQEYLDRSEPWISGVYELVSVTGAAPPTLPKGEVTYRLVAQPSSNPNYLSGTIIFSVDDREAGRMRITAQIDLRIPAVVAARDLPRGHVLTEEDLSESQVAFARAKGALTTIPQAVGQTLKTSVRLGSPVRDRDLVQTSMVRKGEIVTIVAQGGGLKISAVGQSRQDGALGQTISVVNQDSKKTIAARVIGPGMVEVVY